MADAATGGDAQVGGAAEAGIEFLGEAVVDGGVADIECLLHSVAHVNIAETDGTEGVRRSQAKDPARDTHGLTAGTNGRQSAGAAAIGLIVDRHRAALRSGTAGVKTHSHVGVIAATGSQETDQAAVVGRNAGRRAKTGIELLGETIIGRQILDRQRLRQAGTHVHVAKVDRERTRIALGKPIDSTRDIDSLTARSEGGQAAGAGAIGLVVECHAAALGADAACIESHAHCSAIIRAGCEQAHRAAVVRGVAGDSPETGIELLGVTIGGGGVGDGQGLTGHAAKPHVAKVDRGRCGAALSQAKHIAIHVDGLRRQAGDA